MSSVVEKNSGCGMGICSGAMVTGRSWIARRIWLAVVLVNAAAVAQVSLGADHGVDVPMNWIRRCRRLCGFPPLTRV